jgi:SWI/SNF-related matrix-associated actin-dependent regulator of chromatin subfamily A member 5
MEDGSTDDDTQKFVLEEDLEQVEIRKQREEKLKKIRDEQEISTAPMDKRLQYLIAQSEIFAHFLVSRDDDNTSSKKKAEKSGRTRLSEDAEDKQLLKIAQGASRVTRLQQQPKCICFGHMRSYQVEGLNWLIKLYDNGINGILADGTYITFMYTSLVTYLQKWD